MTAALLLLLAAALGSSQNAVTPVPAGRCTAERCYKAHEACVYCKKKGSTPCVVQGGLDTLTGALQDCPSGACEMVGVWSNCSSPCGGGTRRYTVTVAAEGNTSILSRQPCPEMVCNRRPCSAVGKLVWVDTLEIPSAIRGRASLPLPIHLALRSASGGLLAAWADKDGMCRVGTTSADSIRINPAYDYAATEVHGLAVLPSGLPAVLLYTVANGTSLLVKTSGSPPTLVDNAVETSTAGNSLAVSEDGDMLVAYYGRSGFKTVFLDSVSMLPNTKHASLNGTCAVEHHVAWNPSLRTFGVACISAAAWVVFHAPANSSEDPVRVHLCASQCHVGPLLPTPHGFLFVFTASKSHQGVSDVAIANVTRVGTGWESSEIRWVTSAPDTEKHAPQLARYGDGWLAGWASGHRFVISPLTRELNATGFHNIQSWATWGDTSTWVTLPDGSVAWMHSWDLEWSDISVYPPEGTSLLKLVVVRVRNQTFSSSDWCQGERGKDPTKPETGCSELEPPPKPPPADRSQSDPPLEIVIPVLLAVLFVIVLLIVKRQHSKRIVGLLNPCAVKHPWEACDKGKFPEGIEFLEIHLNAEEAK